MTANDVVSRNVRRFREESELSLGELARRAGLAKQTVAAVESSSGNPTLDTVGRLAEALGVSIRALLTELGSDVLVNRRDGASWRNGGRVDVRPLDHVYGSGYVINSVLRLEAAQGSSEHKPSARGTLRHCYVIDGTVRLGPEPETVRASAGDFVRFPADARHVFQALTRQATLFVCTTSPQRTMARDDRAF